MALVMGVEGVKEVLQNLKKSHWLIGDQVAVGLKRAGLFIQRESQKIVPVDTGALKNSAFTRADGRGWNTLVQVGYTQGYAIYVHENLEAKHKKGKVAKYLEKPVREHKDQILKIIRDSAENVKPLPPSKGLGGS